MRLVVQGEEARVSLSDGFQLKDWVVEREGKSRGHGQQRLLLLGHHDMGARIGVSDCVSGCRDT